MPSNFTLEEPPRLDAFYIPEDAPKLSRQDGESAMTIPLEDDLESECGSPLSYTNGIKVSSLRDTALTVSVPAPRSASAAAFLSSSLFKSNPVKNSTM